MQSCDLWMVMKENTDSKKKQKQKIKANIFPYDIFKSDIFHWLQILKYLNEFCNLYIYTLQWAQTKMKQNKIKRDIDQSDSIFFNLQSITVTE